MLFPVEVARRNLQNAAGIDQDLTSIVRAAVPAEPSAGKRAATGNPWPASFALEHVKVDPCLVLDAGVNISCALRNRGIAE